jgi:hypothetical protein
MFIKDLCTGKSYLCMNTFPEEVLYNILIHLPPGHMLLVDKHVNSLHDELYYKEIFPCGRKKLRRT